MEFFKASSPYPGKGHRRNAVINIVDCTLAPPTEVDGDRYIIDNTGGTVHADWDGASKNDIVEFSNTTWISESPVEGWQAFVDDADKDATFIDDGTPQWVLDSVEAHAPTHKSGGSDEIDLDELGTPSDNTNLDATITEHGLLRKLDDSETSVINGKGNWIDQATMKQQAWVEKTGNDGTAKIGDKNFPFLTIQGAITALEVITTSDQVVVHLGAGTWTGETITVNGQVVIASQAGPIVSGGTITSNQIVFWLGVAVEDVIHAGAGYHWYDIGSVFRITASITHTFTGTMIASTATIDIDVANTLTGALSMRSGAVIEGNANLTATIVGVYYDVDAQKIKNVDKALASGQPATLENALDEFAEPTDNTDNDVNSTRHGLAPKGSGSATEFLNGQGNYATPAGSGQANTASNKGTAGVGVFKQKTGVDLEFKKINAGSSKVTVTDDTPDDEVDIDVDGGKILDDEIPDETGEVHRTGAETYDIVKVNLSAVIDPTVNDDDTAGYVIGSKWVNGTGGKAFICLDNTTGSAVWTETTAGASGGEVNDGANVGTGGVGVFKQKSGLNLQFKKINAGSNKLTVTDDVGDDEIDLDVDEAELALANLGEKTYSNLDSRPADDNMHNLASQTGVATNDELLIWDVSLNAYRKTTVANLPTTGSGDMLASTYDPNGLAEDIFSYAEELALIL